MDFSNWIESCKRYKLPIQKQQEALAMGPVDAGLKLKESQSRLVQNHRGKADHREKSELPGESSTPLSNKNDGFNQASFSIGVLGSKGGAGASTMALNLALAFTENRCSCLLIDANFQQPDISIMMGRQPEHSIAELLTRSSTVDETIWQACRLQIGVNNGVECNFLSGPANGEAARKVNLSQLASALPAIQNRAEVIVIDLPKHLDKHLVTVLDGLDLIMLVFDGTLASIAAAKRWINILQELGYSSKKVQLVQNRFGAKGQDCQNDLKTLLQEHEINKVPNSFFLLEKCCSSGEAAIKKKPQDAYSKAIRNLANELSTKKAAIKHKWGT